MMSRKFLVFGGAAAALSTFGALVVSCKTQTTYPDGGLWNLGGSGGGTTTVRWPTASKSSSSLSSTSSTSSGSSSSSATSSRSSSSGTVTDAGCTRTEDCGDLADWNCVNGNCELATCKDGVQNQNETYVDCGGPHCGPCGDSLPCNVGADCLNQVCDSIKKTCVPATCGDGIQNGRETDVDCGSSATSTGPTNCKLCQPGQKCIATSDCFKGNTCNSSRCACPSGMVVASDPPSPSGAVGSYCIDAWEVSYQQYAVFVNGSPSLASMPPGCAWNKDFIPSNGYAVPSALNTAPVRGVNWCQAYTYCETQDPPRHLCGKIDGGPVAWGTQDFADPKVDQWFNACSTQGHQTYPYGQSFVAAKCNGGALANAGDSASQTQNFWASCLGGVSDLYQMSGNVAEWEDSCSGTTGATDTCRVRGGSYASADSAGLQCNADATQRRDYQGADVGFRCCL